MPVIQGVSFAEKKDHQGDGSIARRLLEFLTWNVKIQMYLRELYKDTNFICDSDI